MLNMIAGTIQPTSGELTCLNSPITGLNQRVSYMTQKDTLLPWRNVLDNAALPLEIKHVTKKERYEAARAVLSRVGLDRVYEYRPHQLSGGMRSRLSLARALLSDADIFLMDEPFAAVDALSRLKLQQLVIDVWLETRKTMVYVTHDLYEAIALGRGWPSDYLEASASPSGAVCSGARVARRGRLQGQRRRAPALRRALERSRGGTGRMSQTLGTAPRPSGQMAMLRRRGNPGRDRRARLPGGRRAADLAGRHRVRVVAARAQRMGAADAVGQPSSVASSLWALLKSGTLATALGSTLLAVLYAMIIGAVLGIVLGIFSSMPVGRWLLGPAISVLYAIPKVGLITVFIILIGVGRSSHVALVVSAVMFVYFYAIRQGIEEVREDLTNALRGMGAGPERC